MLKVLSLLPLAQALSPISAPDLSAQHLSAQATLQSATAPLVAPVAAPAMAPTEAPTGIPVEARLPSGIPIALPDTNSLIRVLPRLDVVESQTVRPLPGHLDDVPVFNSNSPELVQKEGILLSTFPGDGMQVRDAHLNHPLEGRFDLFAHHVAKGINADDVRTLYLGVIVYNPAERPIKLEIQQGVTYLSQEAPFHDLPAYVANPLGNVFAGPGSRVTNDILRGQRQPQWPDHVTVPAKSAQLLVNVPIPLRRLTVATNGTLPPGSIIPGLPSALARPAPAPSNLSVALASTQASAQNAALAPQLQPALPPAILPPPIGDNRDLPINGRSILMRLSSSGPVYLASLAMYAPRAASGDEQVPSLSEWIELLRTSGVAGPRDRQPTPPDSRAVPRFYYGRVSGVANGSQWTARATDNDDVNYLSIPKAGEAFSYVISSVDRNTFGTGQIQSAPMAVRYPDTAYRAHGNYGILYNITLPLKNTTDSTQRVAIKMQTPLQDEALKGKGLLFRNPPYEQVFFRGTVKLRYTDDLGIRQTRYMHLVQRRGQEGEPLIRLTLPKGQQRQVEVQLIYPPDATPPQVLTVETQPYNGLAIQPNLDLGNDG
jgi:hypothetical protein